MGQSTFKVMNFIFITFLDRQNIISTTSLATVSDVSSQNALMDQNESVLMKVMASYEEAIT